VWIPASVTHRTTLKRVRSVAVFFDPALMPDADDRVRVLAATPLLREMIVFANRKKQKEAAAIAAKVCALPPKMGTATWRNGLWNTLAFAARNLRLVMKSEWHRFGYACVNFGSPISMRAWCREHGVDFQKLSGDERRRTTAALGAHLMRSVGAVVPVVPVPLIATVFVAHPQRRMSSLEIKAEVEGLLGRLERAGARVYVPRRDFDYAISVGLRMLLMRHLVDEDEGLYAARAGDLALLRYYANSIAHLLEPGAA